MKKLLVFLLTACLHLHAQSQQIHTGHKELNRYNFISKVHNRILYPSGLDSFFHSLHTLQKERSGTISIVHIGDSHIQADFLSGLVRENLQIQFGNAGRGLIFPYQLAQSNAPADILCSSDTRWEFNRLAHPEIDIRTGISGFAIQTPMPRATIGISFKRNQSFNRVTLFTDTATENKWTVSTASRVQWDTFQTATFLLDTLQTSIFITAEAGNSLKELFGLAVSNSQPGILYHTIGVNGARYDHFNRAALFWEQLGALKANLYIISLGTNEAQSAKFNANEFRENLKSFIEKLRRASPNASILITTAPDSYKRNRPNAVLKQLNASLGNYCEQNRLPLWDLYKASNGYGSCASWNRYGLMNKDKIHFTAEGYRVQGWMLFNAMMSAYDKWNSVSGLKR